MNDHTKTLLEVSTLVESNEIKMKRYEDGAITLSSDGVEHFIYLYPAQVEVLRAFMDAKLPGLS